MNKELQLVRCETKLNDFQSCELFNKMTHEQQNALKMYNELKAYCWRFGHTYIDRKVLEMKMKKVHKVIQEESTWEALAFLRKHEVLNGEKEKIALRNFYEYEKEIAECLCQLMEGEPWEIDLDVRKVLQSDMQSDGPMHEESKVTSMKLDPEQVRAAEMMCANAVTVISGKGGCGKTTVVSRIFKAAMEQQKKNGENYDSTSEEGEQKENDDKPVEILLTAPTGRAASLLTQKTCFTAYTIHQVCGLRFSH